MIDNNQSGFSLIEVLISLAILSIGLLGLAIMQGEFANGNSQARAMTRATDIALAQIDTFANAAPSDLLFTFGAHVDQVGPPTYPRVYNIIWNVPAPTNNTLAITVTVNYNYNNRNHSVAFPWIKDI